MKKVIAMAIMAVLPLVAGCGGGGSSATAPPTVAVLTLSATPGTLPAGKLLVSFGATVELPAGVTVKTNAGAPTEADASVVLPTAFMANTGTANVSTVIYTPANSAAVPPVKAKLDFVVSSGAPAGSGVGEGDYVTITCILNGSLPTAADFTITSFTPADQLYAALPGLSVNKAVTLK